jgi:hypothetical protein
MAGMKRLSAGVVIMCAGVAALALAGAAVAGAEGAVDHAAYDTFLKEYVRDGLVDYPGAEKDVEVLHAYLEALSDSSAAHYKTWDRDTRMAFWINAYNALTIYIVLMHYPIVPESAYPENLVPANSIKQIPDVWDTAYVDLAGGPVTLNDIESDILMKEFGDPRVHFALVRGTMGDPRLSPEAFVPERLNQQLESAAVRFVNDGDKVRVNVTRGRLYVSEIFEWYAGDFVPPEDMPEWLKTYKKKARGFVNFIAPRVDLQTREAMEGRILKLTYLDYDWLLNEAPNED